MNEDRIRVEAYLLWERNSKLPHWMDCVPPGVFWTMAKWRVK